MAINYTEVGWTADSYVNPSNMQHTDQGIKAACDGVDRLDEKTEAMTEDASKLENEVERHAFGEQSGGKNIWNEKWNLGDIDATVGQKYAPLSGNHVKSAEPIEVTPNTTYTLVKNKVAYVYFYDANLILLQTYMELSGASSKAFTTPTNTKYICFVMSSNYGTVYNHDLAIIEGGDLSAVYEPYIASNEQLTESANASEVAEAELMALGWCVPSEMPIKNTLANGILTQRVGRVDISSVAWSLYNGVFYANIDAKASRTATYTGSKSILYANGYTAIHANPSMSCGNLEMYEYAHDGNPKRVVIKNTAYSSASDFQNGSKGKYLYYELATPITHAVTDMPSQKSMISDEWDDSKTYTNGSYCIDENVLYRCIGQNYGQKPKNSPTYWLKVSVASEFSVKYRDVTVGSVTIGSNGYQNVSSYRPSGVSVYMCSIFSWRTSANKKCFNVDCIGNYLIGEPNDTISDLVLRYYYK